MAQRPFVVSGGDGSWWCVTEYDADESGITPKVKWDITDQIDNIITTAIRITNSPAARRN